MDYSEGYTEIVSDQYVRADLILGEAVVLSGSLSEGQCGLLPGEDDGPDRPYHLRKERKPVGRS